MSVPDVEGDSRAGFPCPECRFRAHVRCDAASRRYRGRLPPLRFRKRRRRKWSGWLLPVPVEVSGEMTIERDERRCCNERHHVNPIVFMFSKPRGSGKDGNLIGRKSTQNFCSVMPDAFLVHRLGFEEETPGLLLWSFDDGAKQKSDPKKSTVQRRTNLE